MTHEERIAYMTDWCAKHSLTLTLEGECGFGRECVGVLASNDCYPDYEWRDYDTTYERLDNNGDVWTPDDAYHKHPCVAVLGRGENAEEQLYEWLKWFDDNNFKHEVVRTGKNDAMSVLMGANFQARMVRVC
jgi:hypothetical protein